MSPTSHDTRPAGSARRRLVGRFAGLPAWVLLPQLFLAAGWLRAGVEKLVATEWWTGDAVRTFVAAETGHAIGFYEPFLERIVSPLAAGVGILVLVLELAVGGLLAANHRPLAALTVGAALNVQFVLSGVVNPSIFYLVLTMAVVLWHLGRHGSDRLRKRAAKVAIPTAVATAVLLAPSVDTLLPARVIDDPSIVLIFVAGLSAFGVWWTDHEGFEE